MIFNGLLTPRSLSLASLLLTSSLAPLYAQEDLGEFLGQIVVTANRGERPISAIPGSVQVIEEDAISDQLAQGNDATNLLTRLVPGFSFGNQTLSGASETFRGRGVLIMVDGVPRNTPLRDASRSLSLIDLNAIERVEVIGGASSLYGAGGTGGVVNFITKKGDLADGKAKVTVDLKARAFTNDLGDSIAPAASVGIAQKLGAFDYDFTLSADRTRATFDGDGALLPSDPMLGQGGGDYTTKANLGLRLGYDLDDAKRLELSFERVDLEQKPKYFTNYNVSPVAVDLGKPYFGLPIVEDSDYLNLRYTDSAFALGKLTIGYARNDVTKRFAFNIFDPQVNTLV